MKTIALAITLAFAAPHVTAQHGGHHSHGGAASPYAGQQSREIKALSEQELKDLLAFYQTPLGKKIIEAEPKAGEESTKRAQVWIDKYAEGVIAKMRAEMKKRGHSEY